MDRLFLDVELLKNNCLKILFALEVKSLKKLIFPLPTLFIQIVKKSSIPVSLLKVISSEIIYSGIHFSECNKHLSSETFFETLTSKGSPFFFG